MLRGLLVYCIGRHCVRAAPVTSHDRARGVSGSAHGQKQEKGNIHLWGWAEIVVITLIIVNLSFLCWIWMCSFSEVVSNLNLKSRANEIKIQPGSTWKCSDSICFCHGVRGYAVFSLHFLAWLAFYFSCTLHSNMHAVCVADSSSLICLTELTHRTQESPHLYENKSCLLLIWFDLLSNFFPPTARSHFLWRSTKMIFNAAFVSPQLFVLC